MFSYICNLLADVKQMQNYLYIIISKIFQRIVRKCAEKSQGQHTVGKTYSYIEKKVC